MKRMGCEVRSWRLHLRTDLSEQDLARWINPIVRGWMQYYGAFYRTAMYPLLMRVNAYVMRWLRRKYRRLQGWKQADQAWQWAIQRQPRFLAQWAWVTRPAMI
jgi:RNA-directed DNA polymerase